LREDRRSERTQFVPELGPDEVDSFGTKSMSRIVG
jgi:hypothetical protein